MLNRSLGIILASVVMLMPLACDVEKQMDTMVDNPSFAEPLFTKFMARAQYQMKAMDTILVDPAMRQVLLDKIAANPEYAAALAQQLISNPNTRDLVSQLINASQMPDSATQ